MEGTRSFGGPLKTGQPGRIGDPTGGLEGPSFRFNHSSDTTTQAIDPADGVEKVLAKIGKPSNHAARAAAVRLTGDASIL